jgi:hypothetical protein
MNYRCILECMSEHIEFTEPDIKGNVIARLTCKRCNDWPTCQRLTREIDAIEKARRNVRDALMEARMDAQDMEEARRESLSRAL